MQAALNDGCTQHFDPAMLQRSGRRMQWIEMAHEFLTMDLPVGAEFIPCRSAITYCLRGLDHFRNRWQRKLFKVCSVWHRHVFSSDAGNRRVEPIESRFHDACGNLGPDTRLPPAFLDSNDAAGLFDRIDHGFGIHWPER